MTVLVVDDDLFMLKLLSRQLEQLGHDDVRRCERAGEAIALIKADPGGIGLVLCDLQMPGMDGVEFVRQAAAAGYAGSLLLVSGEDPRVVQTVLRLAVAQGLKALGALAKPVSIEALRAMLGHRAIAATSVAKRRAYAAGEVETAILDGQLIAWYQPKVDLAQGAVVGVEALVRWRHPRDGLIYPDQFVPVAERHGLIDPLTREVLRQAVDQVVAWDHQGLELQVAVNVSMDNLTSLGFPDFVAKVLGDAGIAPSRIRLEVTESRLMEDPVTPLDVLARLRLKGIPLSIDDFGTGHSSLAQLRDIPCDELKIDRGFVHKGAGDPSMRAIVEASVGMARQIGMKTVAEGVEDMHDWDFVRETGCLQAQGYFIAKPMQGEELPAWIEGWNVRRKGLLG
jgi:EAL domain-containing protein (putative c-di-GMP-specific phosphodiesterase class I)/FixJ family two-component response regulator